MDDENQPLTQEDIDVRTTSNGDSRKNSFSSSHSARASSSASTVSLMLEHLNSDLIVKKKDYTPYRDADHGTRDKFEELDFEEGQTSHNRGVDSKYRRWLYILGAICATGWVLALILMVSRGSYKHRSTIAHNPDATESQGSGKKVTLEQVQQGLWFPRTASISWIAGPNEEDGLMLEQGGKAGKDYLVVEDVRGWANDPNATKSITLMKQAVFQTETETVVPEEVWPSPDFKTVLIASSKEHHWRHSYTARYWLFDVETQSAQPLDPSNSDVRMQLATWSPDSKAVVFTRDNNMYLRLVDASVTKPHITQITTDGGAEMFNGVPDWVYEEEVFSGNSATWWSGDGKFIAFLATNESSVPEYPVQYFLSRPSNTKARPGLENYPDEQKIKYPKAGAPNPIVHLRFYDVEKGKVFNVPIKDDFEDADRLITEVIWAGKSGKVLIRETNRESDILKMVMIDTVRQEGRIVRTQDVNALDGGWFEVSETTTFIPKDPSNGRPEDGYIDTVIYEGYDHLAYFSPIDNSEPRMLTTGKWEVVDAPSAIDLKNNAVYFLATKDGSIQRHVYSVNMDGSDLKAVTDVRRDGYHAASFSKKGGYSLLSYQGPGIPWQKVISTPSNSERFSQSVEENVALAKLASAHELPRKGYQTVNIDGYDLNVVEILPPHFDMGQKYPVLFFLYGGPGSQTVDKKFSVNFQSYVASSLNYIVVIVDGRGTGFIGRKARTIIRGNLGYWEAHDQIETAKIWANKRYVDESRIAIWGWSYGGYMTLKTLEQDAGNTFHYGMAVAPVTDWSFYDSIYTERWMHTPQHNPEGYANASVSNVTAIGQNVRFLMMHGLSDDNVHFQNSLTLLDKLDLAGIENYDVHVFPDSDHSIFFHNANKIVYDKLSWWLVNAFNGEWAKVKDAIPLRIGQQVGVEKR